MVGQIIWTPDEIRGLIRRVNARYVSLNRDVRAIPVGAGDPLGADFRAGWETAWNAWESFMRDTCEPSSDGRDVCASIRGGPLAQLGWGGTVTQAQEYDRELDAWRERYVSVSGRQPSQPTTSRTADAPTPLAEWRTPIIVIGVAAIVLGGAYALSRVTPAGGGGGGGAQPPAPPPPPSDPDPEDWQNLPTPSAVAV